MFYISKLDIFGNAFNFTIFRKEKFKTIIGGIFTILCVSTIVVFAYFFGEDFFYKKNPKIVQQEVVPIEYGHPDLNYNNFVFMWRVEDFNGNKAELNGFFYPFVLYREYTRKNATSDMTLSRDIMLNNISCDKVLMNDSQLNSSFVLSQWNCMDLNSGNYTLGGEQETILKSYFVLIFSYCPNGKPYSVNNNCTDPAEIQTNFLGDNPYNLNIIYPEYYFTPNDLSNPLKIQYKSYSFLWDMNVQRYDFMHYKKISLIDDLGWIFSSKKNSSLYSKFSLDSTFGFFSEKNYYVEGINSYFYYMKVTLDKQYSLYNRSYMKIQDVLAVVGGFMKIILIVFQFISHLFSTHLRNEFMFNELFDYEKYNSTEISKEKKSDNPNVSFKQPMSLKNNFINDNPTLDRAEVSTVNFKHKELTNNLDPILSKRKTISLPKINFIKQFTIKQEEKKKLQFGIIFLFKKMFCKRLLTNNQDKTKVKIYDFSVKYLKERLDIIYYLKMIGKIDRIKLLLFNYYQNLCFDFIKKPNLFDEEELDNLDMSLQTDRKDNANCLVGYYLEKIKNKNLDNYDLQLYQMVDNSIKNHIKLDNKIEH